MRLKAYGLKSILLVALVILCVFSWAVEAHEQQQINYTNRLDVSNFKKHMVETHGFEMEQLDQWFAEVNYKQSIIDAISRPAEKVFTWGRYRNIFLKDKRINQGVKFWQKNQHVLDKVEAEFGVPAEIVVAIIGVETHFGTVKGSYRVIDALSTLAFDYPKRSTFFKKELAEFLLLAREQGKSPLHLKGSYAGAMGYGQFMPSSYRHYAKDFDSDGFIDIWDNQADAIWSVANYLVAHKWRENQSVSFQVPAEQASVLAKKDANTSLKLKRTLSDIAKQIPGLAIPEGVAEDAPATLMFFDANEGDQYWVGLDNFYVITRYNHSKLYAMAVYQLSQAIKDRR